MTVSTDATEPGSVASTSTSVAPAVSVLQATQVPTSVQDAIDANVAAYRASLESQIKTTVAPTAQTPAPVPGLLSRAASVTGAAVSDVKSGVGDVVSGAELAGGDFLAVIKGKPAQIQNSAGVEQSIPRWLMYAVFALAIVGAGALTDLALHALHVL